MSAAPVNPNEECSCGSGHFELHDDTRPDDSNSSAVALNALGSVLWYSGQARCIECKKPWEAGKRPKLAVVR